MKLVHQDFSRPIFEEKDNFVELIIESPECLGAYISELAEPELKVEVTVYTENVDKTIEVVKAVHPYEEPVINVIPLWRTSF